MNKDQQLDANIELGAASVETRGIDPQGLEVTGGHRQGMGISDLD